MAHASTSLEGEPLQRLLAILQVLFSVVAIAVMLALGGSILLFLYELHVSLQ